MRILWTALIICTAINVTAPAHGEPTDAGGGDLGFLADLQHVGIRFPDPAGAVSAGKAVCGCLNNGESGLEVVHDLKARNPGFNMEDASDFAMISAKSYCPHHLSKS